MMGSCVRKLTCLYHDTAASLPPREREVTHM
jgi:hypothetical protein